MTVIREVDLRNEFAASAVDVAVDTDDHGEDAGAGHANGSLPQSFFGVRKRIAAQAASSFPKKRND